MIPNYFYFLFALLLSCGCTCGNNFEYVHSEQQKEFSKEFEALLINFQGRQFPLDINRSDLKSYGLTVYDTITEKYKTSSFPVIQNKFLKFICRDTSDINSSFRGLYKFQFSDFLILVYIKDVMSTSEDLETWIMLNTYDKEGSILDTLSIAGSKMDQIEKFVSITVNSKIEINIKTYQFLPENPNVSALYAIELKQNYIIDEKGRLKLIANHEKEDYFILDDNEYKVSKKD
jgi:hypothetical protein